MELELDRVDIGQVDSRDVHVRHHPQVLGKSGPVGVVQDVESHLVVGQRVVDSA